MAKIKSVKTSTGRRVQLGSKAAERHFGAGETAASGTGKNLSRGDIKDLSSNFEGFTDEVSTTAAKREANAAGDLLPYQTEQDIPTGQPSPTTVEATPFTQAAPDSPEAQAQKVMAQTGFTGGQSTQPGVAPAASSSPYATGFSAAMSSGAPAPSSAGDARSAMKSFMPPTPPDTSAVDLMLGESPEIQNISKMFQEYFDPKKQKDTLLSDYKNLYEQSGLEELDEEIIDAKTIIEGTEDDIRNEVEAAGGFATESQVQAMSLARNKSLLKNYNNLVALREMRQNHLDTMVNLTKADKEMAMQRLDSQMNFAFKVLDFKQKAQNDVREAFNNVVDRLGYGGAYAAYAGNPRQLAMIESITGLGQGGLAQLAAQPDLERTLKEEQIKTERAQRAKLNEPDKRSTQVVDVGGRKILIDSQTGEQISEIGGGSGATSEMDSARRAANISNITGLLNHSALQSSVGPNALSRLDLSQSLTGKKSDFIATVEQLRANLTLDSLVGAKERGATFGALSDAEMQTLSAAGSKLGTWAQKDDSGNVTGYKTSESSFKKEMDTINNFAKLDAVLKGVDPTSVGVQVMPDGTYWTTNSDGSYTQLR